MKVIYVMFASSNNIKGNLLGAYTDERLAEEEKQRLNKLAVENKSKLRYFYLKSKLDESNKDD